MMMKRTSKLSTSSNVYMTERAACNAVRLAGLDGVATFAALERAGQPMM